MTSRITLLALLCVAAAAQPALRGPKMMQLNFARRMETEKNKKVTNDKRSAQIAYEHQDQMEQDVHWDLELDSWKTKTAAQGLSDDKLGETMERLAKNEAQVSTGVTAGKDADEGKSSASMLEQGEDAHTRWQEEAQVVSDVQAAKNEGKNFEGQVSDGQQEMEQAAIGTEQTQTEEEDNEEEGIQNALDQNNADQEEMVGEFAKKTFKTSSDADGVDVEEQAKIKDQFKDLIQHKHDAKIKRELLAMDRRQKRDDKHNAEEEKEKQEMFGGYA